MNTNGTENECTKGVLYYFSADSAKALSSDSHALVTLGSLLDDQHWHSVLIERVNKHINFTVDKNTQQFQIKGQFDPLNIDYEVCYF